MKSIIMVGGGVQEVPAVCRIKEMGFTSIVTDINPNALGFQEADICVNISARDIQSLIAWIMLKKEELNIRGIFTLINQAASVALVASATGLPTLPAETVVRCDNKLLMKRAFAAHRLPTAQFKEVTSYDEAIEVYKQFGKEKLYLKVVDGFGGKGIQMVSNVDEIQSAFASVKEMSKFPCLIAEEPLTGSFIDVQGFFYKDNFYPAGSADSYFTSSTEELSEFNPVEDFNISPSQQPSDVIEQSYALLEKASRCLGITWGPVGGDFIVSEGGLKIIEIGPRLHGPNGTLQIFPLSTGIRPFEFLIQCVADEEPDKGFLKEQYNKVALCKVFVCEKTEIKKVYFTKDPLTIPGVCGYHMYWNEKEQMIQKKSSLSGLTGIFICSNTYQKALEALKKVEEVFVIE